MYFGGATLKTPSYEELAKHLYELALKQKSRSHLDEVKQIYDRLLIKKMPYIHIAGTNGKGSCSIKIASALQASGYQVGCYTSPHISTFRERMTFNGKMISKELVEELLPSLFSLAPHLTFFEICTLLAFSFFSKMNADIAVIEVGLGGRLDATNCIHPILSIITSIGLDHQTILGDTHDQIAKEKGGIIKPQVPVLLGPSAQLKVLKELAKVNQSPLYQVSGNYSCYDDENQHIAKQALGIIAPRFPITENVLEKALQQKPLCRLQKMKYKGRSLLLDISHNPDGMNYLFEGLRKNQKQVTVFFASSSSHNIKALVSLLEQNASEVFLLDARHPRLLDPAEINTQFSQKCSILSIEQALKKVEMGSPNTLYVFTGSVFAMHPLLEKLKVPIEQDTLPIQDGSFSFR